MNSSANSDVDVVVAVFGFFAFEGGVMVVGIRG